MNEKRNQKNETDEELLERLPKSIQTFIKMRQEFSADGGSR